MTWWISFLLRLKILVGRIRRTKFDIINAEVASAYIKNDIVERKKKRREEKEKEKEFKKKQLLEGLLRGRLDWYRYVCPNYMNKEEHSKIKPREDTIIKRDKTDLKCVKCKFYLKNGMTPEGEPHYCLLANDEEYFKMMGLKE